MNISSSDIPDFLWTLSSMSAARASSATFGMYLSHVWPFSVKDMLSGSSSTLLTPATHVYWKPASLSKSLADSTATISSFWSFTLLTPRSSAAASRRDSAR